MKKVIGQKISARFPGVDFDVLVPPEDKMGDYSTNIAFALARQNFATQNLGGLTKKEAEDPFKIGQFLVNELKEDKELASVFEKIEVVKPGFINFYLSDDFLRKQLGKIAQEDNYGFNEKMKGKTVMVEYTDPNPFKLFHIGHLMSNTIGEAISRLYEASGAKVLRANYQGDIGLHVAKAIWGMKYWPQTPPMPLAEDSMDKKMEFLGNAYVSGAYAYENPEFKTQIEEINEKIYSKSDKEIQKLYEKGKKWSLEYFEAVYKKLGTKFDRYFFESEAATDGLSIVEKHPDVFVESDGAKVFRGEEHGLHTRVFVSSKGLPTYEAKELGVNKKKFEKDKPDLSIIVTGNEINEYFKVLLRVMELTMPEVAARTKHISHGMLRLPGGRGVGPRALAENSVKMSSRTGEVITADSLIEQTKSRLPESAAPSERASPSETEREDPGAKEKIAIGAIKYSILKQSPGHDIVFDFEKSLSVKGDSAPYLQYTYARLNSIVAKAGQRPANDTVEPKYLVEPVELALIKRLLKFPDVVAESSEEIAPQHLALYLYELSNDANRFYENIRVLDDEGSDRRNARLMLVETVAAVLERGLGLLGISALKRI